MSTKKSRVIHFSLECWRVGVLECWSVGSSHYSITPLLHSNTGESDAKFEDKGIVFDGTVGGPMYFTDAASQSILKFSGGTLSTLTTECETIQP
jgi:hypothetical protein